MPPRRIAGWMLARLAIVLVMAMAAGSVFVVFRRYQERQSAEEMQRWFTRQETKYQKDLALYDKCKSDAEFLRLSGSLVAAAQKSFDCLPLEPFPFHREILKARQK